MEARSLECKFVQLERISCRLVWSSLVCLFGPLLGLLLELLDICVSI